MKAIYIHDTIVHNTNAANEIVPDLINKFKPKSVVDVGCGIGSWLNIFNKNGISDFVGIDGDYLDRDLLMIDSNKFLTADLCKPFRSEKKFDLVLSLEVAEHLPEMSAEDFVKTLTDLGDIIIFSAAIPGQGGQNHLNEQFPEYWQAKFSNYGFEVTEYYSPKFWNNNKIEWWYRQNIFIYEKINIANQKFDFKFNVHPELYKRKLVEIENLNIEKMNIYKGKIPIVQSFKIFCKSILHYFDSKK